MGPWELVILIALVLVVLLLVLAVFVGARAGSRTAKK